MKESKNVFVRKFVGSCDGEKVCGRELEDVKTFVEICV